MLVRRENKYGSDDLNVIYRPCTLNEVVGNETVINIIKNQLSKKKFPHTNLFTGDSGCGKTTVARIVAMCLNCEEGVTPNPCLKCASCISVMDKSNIDVAEIDVGRRGGKDAVENYLKDLPLAPMMFRYKVLIFDEAHKLSDAAKSSLFKETEDGYSHVYFIFCTDQPDKLMKKDGKRGAFLGRCKHLIFNPLNEEQIRSMVVNVCDFEGEAYTEDVINHIVEYANGVPREALVYLSNVIADGRWELAPLKESLSSSLDENSDIIIDLSKVVLKCEWKNSVQICERLLKKHPAESIRVSVVGYLVGVLKRKGDYRVSAAIDGLIEPIYQTGKPAEHVLYNGLYKAIRNIGKGF